MIGEVIVGHLRRRVFVLWIILVNVVGFFAMWLRSRYPEIEATVNYVSLTLIFCGTAAFAVSIANDERVRAFAVGSSEHVPALSKELNFVAAFCILMWAASILNILANR
jgi:hypothetical protein